MLRSKFVKFFMSILKRQVDSSPSSVSFFSFMKDYSSVLFISNNIYFAQKETIKMKMFETFKCLGQFHQIPYANFETTSRFLSKFCISLQFHERLFHCTFFSSNNTYFAQKEPIKVEIFETFECSGEILLNSLC